MKVFFSAIVECGSCSGTGLYQGMCERDGAAVICHRCKGEGFREVRHEYNQFAGRKHTSTVSRVYETAGVYAISAKRIETKEGKVINFQYSGCSYEEWKRGIAPEPIRELHCPLEHCRQGTAIGEALKKDGPCSTFLTIGGHITECSKENRETCWKWFDLNIPK